MKNPKVGESSVDWKYLGDHFQYSVSSDGDIWSHNQKRILKGTVSQGYRSFCGIVASNGKKRPVTSKIHHLVIEAFIGPRPVGKVINHKNGIKLDNRLENLEYCTPKENRDHAKLHRLYKSGSKCSWSKLSEEEVLLIRRSYAVGLSYNQLARAFMVSKKTILLIIKKRTWYYAEIDAENFKK